MSGARLLRILARMSQVDPADPSTAGLCAICADVTGMTGAGIMLSTGDDQRGSLGSTDAVSAIIEQLQETLGEGPCVDAVRSGRPVLEPDLAAPVEIRWPAFGGPAVAAGARAVFGFPVALGAVRLGAMDLYRDRPGPMSDDAHADALVMAGVVARVVIGLQAGAPADTLGAELEVGLHYRFVVHQATGMVATQLGVGMAEALIRLRGDAFARGLLVDEVARDVVERRRRFGPST